MRCVPIVLLAVALAPVPSVSAQQTGPIHDAIAKAVLTTPLMSSSTDESQTPAPRHLAFEYSEGYKTRAKVHKAAAFATLPLFATEFALGQSLYTNPSDSKKGAHIAVGTGIIGLYGVQAVTGVWNLIEANKDPHGKKKRITHAILMLASGAGFAITPMLAPGEREEGEFSSGSASTHRAVAFTSIGVGTVGYLLMLLGGK